MFVSDGAHGMGEEKPRVVGTFYRREELYEFKVETGMIGLGRVDHAL